jgi:hypothetical protein
MYTVYTVKLGDYLGVVEKYTTKPSKYGSLRGCCMVTWTYPDVVDGTCEGID